MPILEINVDFAGEAGVNPRLVRITCNDNLSVITTENYLKPVIEQGYYIYPTDLIAIAYAGGTDWFKPSIDSSGNITLTNTTGNVTVSGSVTSGHIVSFANASTIQDAGFGIVQGISPFFLGGSTFYTFSAPGVIAFSNIIVTLRSFTNAGTYIVTAGSSTNGQITIQFNQDPGTDTSVNYVAFA